MSTRTGPMAPHFGATLAALGVGQTRNGVHARASRSRLLPASDPEAAVAVAFTACSSRGRQLSRVAGDARSCRSPAAASFAAAARPFTMVFRA